MSEVLWAAGRPIVGADTLVRRYCGAGWSDQAPEVWAYAYFEGLPSPSDGVERLDVLACAALHSGLTHADLAWFIEAADDLDAVLDLLPRGVSLTQADGKTIDAVEQLRALASRGTRQAPRGVGLALLSKVLHRKRPQLIPIFDRAISERYRHVTGVKGGAAWAPLVHAIRADLANEDNGLVLEMIGVQLREEGIDPVPSALRLLDIAIWMDARTGGGAE